MGWGSEVVAGWDLAAAGSGWEAVHPGVEVQRQILSQRYVEEMRRCQ